MNIFPASAVLADDDADAADIHFGVRPEHMQVHIDQVHIDPADDASQQPSGVSDTPAVPASHATVRGTIDIVEELGAESYIYLEGNTHRFVARWHADTRPRRGQTVTLSFDPASAHRFDAETGHAVGGNSVSGNFASGNSVTTHDDSGHNE